MPRAPTGFIFLSACSFLCACAMAFGLTYGVADFSIGPAGRFGLAATGALALVTAEALAFVRPWAFSASLAFAASFVAMTFAVMSSVDDSLMVASVVAFPILIALLFVYNGLRPVRAVTPGPRRIGVPAPRPAPGRVPRPPGRSTRPPARPAGFTFLSACAGLCACVMAGVLAQTGDVSLPGRFVAAATGALALVTAEALACVRPWAFSASVALAGTFVVMIFVTVSDVTAALVTAGLVTFPILIALSIVYNGLASLSATAHKQASARIRVP